MKVAVWHNLPTGGGRRALAHQVRGLVDAGHRVRIWSPPSPESSFAPFDPRVEQTTVPLRRANAPRAHDPLALYRRVTSARQNAAHLFEHSALCAAEIGEAGFEILLAHPCRFNTTTPIGRLVQVPSVLYLQEPNRSLYEANPHLPWIGLPEPTSGGLRLRDRRDRLYDFFKNRMLRAIARAEYDNARGYDRILVNSLYSRERVLAAYGIDARVCYLGIDTDVFRYDRRPRENLAIGVGAFVPAKNVDFVIRAIATIQTRRPRLIWVGNFADDGYLTSLRRLAERLAVDFVARTMVTDDELVDLLNRAGVFAYAPRLEPFGYAPLEAGACGLPVVAVAEAGIRETVFDQQNGLLVEPEPAAMGEAIQRILADDRLAAKLGDGGRTAVRTSWTLRAAAERLESHLVSTLTAGQVRRAAGGRAPVAGAATA